LWTGRKGDRRKRRESRKVLRPAKGAIKTNFQNIGPCLPEEWYTGIVREVGGGNRTRGWAWECIKLVVPAHAEQIGDDYLDDVTVPWGIGMAQSLGWGIEK